MGTRANNKCQANQLNPDTVLCSSLQPLPSLHRFTNNVVVLCYCVNNNYNNNYNYNYKVVKKLSKYKDLEIPYRQNVENGNRDDTSVIGALGVIKKGLEKYVDKIPGTVSIDELQEITLLGTAHILRKVLSIK